jgi:hypothetical protein
LFRLLLFECECGVNQGFLIAPEPPIPAVVPRVNSYAKAGAELQESEIALAIGCSFNQHDRACYEPLLCALRRSPGRRLLVIAPEADAIAATLRSSSPGLQIEPIKATFKQWVEHSFPGLD